ncbi:hypothetical protein OF897_03875 [Chryseobacterium formosus]|uniref:Uncharacterized protein n=1 Tax=Chryseobacterium formosus TaxID=1537363 RepID=A0ABT3XLP7_9FLAO|nr:hypothetical protein [Chryseobacterium formosus]MCX8523058.1 hypothetical protein [Chryseobacterium formosus]
MKAKQFFIFLGSLFIVTLGTIVFITGENDHKECKHISEYSISKDGTKIKTGKHICKERFNF